MPRKNHPSGFALIETLLVVVILAMVGFIGWYVWHAKQDTDKTFSDTNKSTSALGTVSNFAECEKAKGSVIGQTFPEKCVTKDGKTFTSTITINPGGVMMPTKAAADSPTPAAGTCLTTGGSVVTVTLSEGVPDPRCTRVTASQTLKVVNPTSKMVTVTLGSQSVDLAPGQSGPITVPFGDYLEAGDHVMKTAPALYGGSGPEIYLPAS
jgi:type II secretory pathway pseudopilin PulG